MRILCVFLILLTGLPVLQAQAGNPGRTPTREIRKRVIGIVRKATPKPQRSKSGMTYVSPKPLLDESDYQAVATFGVAAIEPLMEFLRSDNPFEQRTAMRLLDTIQSEEAVDGLIRYATEAKGAPIRIAAISFLSAKPVPKVLALLGEIAKKDADEEVRGEATRRLREMKASLEKTRSK